MECSIHALIACFSWAGLYIDSGLSYQDAGVYRSYEVSKYERQLVNGAEQSSGETHQAWDRHSAQNPYGRLALGYEIDLGQLTWRIEAEHVSSLTTSKDRGVNSFTISAKWYPFRR